MRRIEGEAELQGNFVMPANICVQYSGPTEGNGGIEGSNNLTVVAAVDTVAAECCE